MIVSNLPHLILAGGAQSGRAAAAEKQIEKMKAEGLIPKPFVPKKRSFTFPPVEKMGQRVVGIEGMSCNGNLMLCCAGPWKYTGT